MPAGTGEHRQLQLFTIFYIKKQSVHYRILKSYKDTLHARWLRFGYFRAPFPVSSNRKPARRLRFEKEEQRRECALTYKISRSKRYIACSDVANNPNFNRISRGGAFSAQRGCSSFWKCTPLCYLLFDVRIIYLSFIRMLFNIPFNNSKISRVSSAINALTILTIYLHYRFDVINAYFM